MLKKCLFIVVAVAVMLSMATFGSAAEGISDSLVVDLAFSADGVTDLKGHTIEVNDDGEITFNDGYVTMASDPNVTNQIVVKDVVSEESPVTFTIELYVKLDTGAAAYDLFTLGSGNVNVAPLDSQTWFGAGRGIAGDCDSYYSPGLPQEGEYTHVVFTSDGLEQNIYVDGVCMTDELEMGGAYTVDTIYGASDVEGKDTSLFLGSYFTTAGRITNYEVKICRYYNVAATADEAAAMYEARETVSTTDGVDIPTPPPTQEPSDESSDGEVNNATPAPTKPADVSNTTTFDLGLVSLAAVALSSAVVMKKRK